MHLLHLGGKIRKKHVFLLLVNIVVICDVEPLGEQRKLSNLSLVHSLHIQFHIHHPHYYSHPHLFKQMSFNNYTTTYGRRHSNKTQNNI